jgi:predicted GH43/DUF377 family glycosyl hydrolase
MDVPQFQGVPLADASGIVLGVKRISVPLTIQGYNPSIVATKKGYILACRDDLLWVPRIQNTFPIKQVQIVLMRLNSRFQMVQRAVSLDLAVSHAEDPRLFYVGDRLFLCYNSFSLGMTPVSRAVAAACPRRMALAEIDPQTLLVTKNMKLGYWAQPWEKNWVPLVYTDSKKKPNVYFVYSANPFTVLKLEKPITGAIERPAFFVEPSKKLMWEDRFGTIRGGTPAIKIGSEYLTFFHSCFEANYKKWYVFGAMTFAGKPPFRIQKISQYPILFRRMYSTKSTLRTWWYPRKRLKVTFPSGCVLSKSNGREVIYLVIGENDSGMKLITLDTKKLLNSLRDFRTQVLKGKPAKPSQILDDEK